MTSETSLTRSGDAHSGAQTPEKLAERGLHLKEAMTTEAQLCTLLAERILLLDGAMGTVFQSYGLREQDYRGTQFLNHPQHLQGNNDLLNLSRPDIVGDIHRAYLAAGADIISTNTFGANAISLADYGLAGLAHELNVAGARLARAAADSHKTADRPVFVAGVLGPTNRTASISPDVSNPALRNVQFMDLVEGYTTAIEGLVEGGADILLVETIFDTLNAKAAVYAIDQWFENHGRRLPVMISGTITDAAGRTLTGQTPTAFWYSLRHIRPLSIGLNCALGPGELRQYVEELAACADTHVSAHPNAGLPDAFGRYLETPEDMARHLGEWARDGLVNIVGGCCGTTPAHIRATAAAIAGTAPRPIPKPEVHCRLSGLEPLAIRPEANFINIGERTNVAGSPRFLQLIREHKLEAALAIARQQVENGAQIIDICMDEGLLDTRALMQEFLNLIAGEPDICRVPIMIDSSSWEVIETGLRCLQGKGIVNSISLKEGEEKFLAAARRIRRYGAAVVVMAFDEEGQAATTERRFAICQRSYRLLTEKLGFPPEDIIFDPNVLTVATGMAEHNDYALSFFETARLIKQHLPHALVSGGLSNVSFSFRGNNPVREAMHSAFLYHGIKAGMDMAIVNAGQLGIYDAIPPLLLERIEDVLLNRRPDATDRLVELAESFRSADVVGTTTAGTWTDQDVMQRIRLALIKGLDEHIESDINLAFDELGSALQVIEGPLMTGMKEVGEMFGAGKMFLPQVVKSARVMKKAVACLLPHLEEERRQTGRVGSSNGRIVLATVKGDVHDIGKNIVSVVLQCNNFEIIDLGVMAPAERILHAAREQSADMIALSGLITPSLDEMAHVAAEMQRLGFTLPLLVGGATTSPAHTAIKIASAYAGPVVHIRDASRAAIVAQQLANPATREEFLQSSRAVYAKLRREHQHQPRQDDLLSIAQARNNRWQPPDWTAYQPPVPRRLGIQVFHDFPLTELLAHIDWTPFFSAWGLSGKYPDILTKGSKATEAQRLFADAQAMLERIVGEKWLEAKGAVGLFPANSIEDDIELYRDEDRDDVLLQMHSLRQQGLRPAGQPNLALADFIAPRESGVRDYIGAFALSAGFEVSSIVQRLEKEHDDYQAIMLRAIADRLAEAFSEAMHERVRRQLWGHAGAGIRPAPGYPTNPDHTEKLLLWKLLDAERNTGIVLTENLAMSPAASVCGLYFSHPDSRYFGIGKLPRDQVADYAGRKGLEQGVMEKWLGPHLAYDSANC